MGKIVNSRLDRINSAIGSANVAQSFRDNLQQSVNANFELASDYYVVKSQDRSTGLWEDIGVRLVKPYKLELNNSIRDDFYQIIFKDGTRVSNLGDMFEWNNYRYMVSDVGWQMSPTSSCFVQRCNVQLRFVASNSAVVGSTPSYYSIDGIATVSMSMPTEGRTSNLSDDEMVVKIPNSEAARLIRYDSRGGTRFLIRNPYKSYTTVAMDSTTYVRKDLNGDDSNGFIVLKLSNKPVQNNNRMDNYILGLAKQECY